MRFEYGRLVSRRGEDRRAQDIQYAEFDACLLDRHGIFEGPPFVQCAAGKHK